MKTYLYAFLITVCLAAIAHAVPLHVDFPSKNITVKVEGNLVLDTTTPIEMTFNATGETISFTQDSYNALRSVMDSIYGVTTNTVLTAPITITVPTSSIQSLSDVLQ